MRPAHILDVLHYDLLVKFEWLFTLYHQLGEHLGEEGVHYFTNNLEARMLVEFKEPTLDLTLISRGSHPLLHSGHETLDLHQASLQVRHLPFVHQAYDKL